jgi:hypothetical protein
VSLPPRASPARHVPSSYCSDHADNPAPRGSPAQGLRLRSGTRYRTARLEILRSLPQRDVIRQVGTAPACADWNADSLASRRGHGPHDRGGLLGQSPNAACNRDIRDASREHSARSASRDRRRARLLGSPATPTRSRSRDRSRNTRRGAPAIRAIETAPRVTRGDRRVAARNRETRLRVRPSRSGARSTMPDSGAMTSRATRQAWRNAGSQSPRLHVGSCAARRAKRRTGRAWSRHPRKVR